MGKKSDRAEKAANKKNGVVDTESQSEDEIPKSATTNDNDEDNYDEEKFQKEVDFDIGEAIEMLTEKKMNLREPGLLSIIKHLQSHRDVEHDALDDYHDTLTTLLVRMIRRPASVKEGQLLCRLICLIALYNGADENDYVVLFEKPLQSIIDGKLGTGYDDLQDFALFTLIFITFICGNEESNRNYLTYLQDLILGEASAHLKGKAVDCWVLLASQSMPSEILEVSKDEGLFEGFVDLLEQGEGGAEVAGNVAAGRGLAFLWEMADAHHGMLHGEESHPDLEESGRMLCDDPRVVDNAVDLIRRVAKESSKKVSKKNRKEQRAEFRDIECFILEGVAYSDDVRMQGHHLEITSFAQARIVDTLKDVLETGFFSSLHAYPIVKDILSIEYVSKEGTAASKVSKDSTQSKRRTQDRHQDRRVRDAYTGANDFWGED